MKTVLPFFVRNVDGFHMLELQNIKNYLHNRKRYFLNRPFHGFFNFWY